MVRARCAPAREDSHEPQDPARRRPAWRHRSGRPDRLQDGRNRARRRGHPRNRAGVHARQHGQDGEAGRRFLRLRQRQLAEDHANPRRPLEHQQLVHRPAGDRDEHEGAGRRVERVCPRRRHRCGEDQGLLRRIHGHRRDRRRRACSGPVRSRSLRRDQRRRRAVESAGRAGPRRRRSAQQHQLRHRKPVRGVRHPVARGRRGDAVPAPGRARDARARVLLGRRRQDGRAA